MWFCLQKGTKISCSKLRITLQHDWRLQSESACLGALILNDKVFRQLGRRQKHWVTGSLDDWVTEWLSHWMTESLYDWLLTCTDTCWHALTRTDTHWHALTCTDTYWHVLPRSDKYSYILASTIWSSLLRSDDHFERSDRYLNWRADGRIKIGVLVLEICIRFQETEGHSFIIIRISWATVLFIWSFHALLGLRINVT